MTRDADDVRAKAHSVTESDASSNSSTGAPLLAQSAECVADACISVAAVLDMFARPLMTNASSGGCSMSEPAVDDYWAQPPLFPAGQEQKTSDDYYTPKHVFDLLGLRFDLDVCAPPGGVPWVPADRFYTKADDGLAQPWHGRVWMNPPYSEATAWVRRFIVHRHGVALMGHAKSAWHPTLWAEADAVAFPFRYFDFVGGSIMLPVWFAAFGDECVEALHRVGVVRYRGTQSDGQVSE